MNRWLSFLSTQRPTVLVAVAAFLFGLMLYDELAGGDEPITLWHLFSELLDLGLLVGTTVTCALLAIRFRDQADEHSLLRRDLEVIRARDSGWRAELVVHLREVGAAIQQQFRHWGLTPAEEEIGLLLLKGFSHKEIARFRQSSEATVRQQAASLYRKGGLSGRAALSAYFLEDLLLPPPVDQPALPAAPSSQSAA